MGDERELDTTSASEAARRAEWLQYVDEKILDLCAFQSPNQIVATINSQRNPYDEANSFEPTAEYVIQRAKQILDDSRWLEQLQLEHHLLLRMFKMLNALEDDFYAIKKSAGVVSLEHAKVQIQTLKMIGGQLEKRRKVTEEELSVFDENVGREILRTVDRALGHMRGHLTGAGQIEEAEWDSALEAAMAYAAQPLIEKAPAIMLPGETPEPTAVAVALEVQPKRRPEPMWDDDDLEKETPDEGGNVIW